MKSTFLLHLFHSGSANAGNALGSIIFSAQEGCSPETAIVTLRDVVHHCTINPIASPLATDGVRQTATELGLSTRHLYIHLSYIIDKQNLGGVVGGVARYTSNTDNSVILMTVHGHMLSDSGGRDRIGVSMSHEPNGEGPDGPWEGNTGW